MLPLSADTATWCWRARSPDYPARLLRACCALPPACRACLQGDSASPLLTLDLAHNSWYSTHCRVPLHRVLVRRLPAAERLPSAHGMPAGSFH